jgi:hypothetical protein
VCATLMEARASAAGDIQDLRCAGRWPCAGACCGWRLRCLLSGDGRGVLMQSALGTVQRHHVGKV